MAKLLFEILPTTIMSCGIAAKSATTPSAGRSASSTLRATKNPIGITVEATVRLARRSNQTRERKGRVSVSR